MRVAAIHGFAGTPEVWEGVTPAGCQHVALPGHGGGWVRETWDANLRAVRTQLGPTDVAIGYSLGARVALGLLAMGAVERVVLISVHPGLPGAERTDGRVLRETRRRDDAAWAARLRRDGTTAFADAWSTQPLFATQARVPTARLAARRSARCRLDAEELARCLEVMGLAEMPDYRGAIEPARVTLVVGAEDAKFSALAAGLDAPRIAIPDCGHDPTLEQPARLADVLAAALAPPRSLE